MFYSLTPSKGLNPRIFCWWDPRSGIFYWWNLESWALESRIQTKKSRIPVTTDTQFHLPRLESGTGNPECKVCNPEPTAVLDSVIWGKQTNTLSEQTLAWRGTDLCMRRTDLYMGRTQLKCRIKTFPLKLNW